MNKIKLINNKIVKLGPNNRHSEINLWKAKFYHSPSNEKIIYNDVLANKKKILEDNKQKCGIYMWVNKINVLRFPFDFFLTPSAIAEGVKKKSRTAKGPAPRGTAKKESK